MRRSILPIAILASAAALVLAPHRSSSQATTDTAPRDLLATSYMDALLNPAKGEDTEFFIRAGGVPNIFFLVDSSGSMERLPPDGPATYGGSSPTMPPGILLADPGDSGAQTTARNGRTIVGCGVDTVSRRNTAFWNNPMVQHILSRKFFPPCGRSRNRVDNLPYGGHAGVLQPDGSIGPDYANESSVCPYYTSSNSQTVDLTKGGYDPDFYNPSPNTNQIPNVLFAKDLVYHDSVYLAAPYERNSRAFSHNFGKGWQASAPPVTFPYQATSSSYASIDQFCDEQGTAALANGQVPSTVCKQCLKEAGWYYDGVILEGAQDASGVVKQYPSIWYTGNYLNFFPPKFVAVRKIVKDVVATQSKVRMALADFGATGMNWLKEFNPTCAHPDSNFDSNRSTYVSLLDTIVFDGTTPLSVALFDVGRYYHSPGLAWFGSDWAKPTTGNQTWYSSSNSNDYAICYSCQTSSVILLTDGLANPNDGWGLPPGSSSIADSNADKYAGDPSTGIRGASTTDCPACGAFSGTDDYKNNLARVSFYLHNYDLRDNDESTKDCKTNGGKQTLDVYTVGYSTATLPDANTILAGAGSAGGGMFVAAEDPSALRTGLLSVIQEISGRSTSFSVATVSTLQTASGHSVIVPRFDPARSFFWKGHLYGYDLYSEFVNACDPSNTSTSTSPPCCKPNEAGDLDCDGKCESVFLRDKNGKFVQEGGDGFFYVNSPNLPACSQASACGTTCGGVGSARATPWWDAAEGLAATGWKARKVFTVVDRNGDGRIDQDDVGTGSGLGPVELDTSSDDAANLVLPYLGLGGGQVCGKVADRIATAGDALTAAVVRATPLECAKAILRWIRGADVFNEAGRKATDSPRWPPALEDPGRPGTAGDPDAGVARNIPNQESLPERPHKLGDVFHSSPVVVDPPLPLDGILCPNGLHNQCLTSLWKTPTEDSADAAYTGYYQSAAYVHRRKIILVGSNDGVLHAFDGGGWHEGDDLSTEGIDEGRWPFDGHYDRGEGPDGSDVWAGELWAFVAPDLLPKLGLVLGGEHQLMVDGTAMVRDVWVDGTSNGLDSATTADDVKQKQEFHTVAVVGERRGGSRYFALDVTNATKFDSEVGTSDSFPYPTFLWMYPQPSDADSLAFAETYDDFLPTPPPIGPVRIEANDAHEGYEVNDDTPTMVVEGTGNVRYHEKWIAFLSGGFDPSYLRGRGVHMVDVWSGKELWDFSYDPSLQDDDPRKHLVYPVASAVGMVMWGPGSRRDAGLGFANDGFFDTATFGDAGGQVWTLRFHDPGTLGDDGKVTNWVGGRAFQMGDSGTETFGYQHPFFYITANTALPGSYIFRTYLGTGDRFNLLDTGGGVCGPDNIRACLVRGCTVSLDAASNYLATPTSGRKKAGLSETAKGSTSYPDAASLSDGSAIDDVEGRARIVISSCPSPEVNNGPTSMTKDVSFACTRDAASRWGCAATSTANQGGPLALSNSSDAPSLRNWYFSLRVFEDTGDRAVFSTADAAKRYDAARLWLKDTGAGATPTSSTGIVVIDGGNNSPSASSLATESSAGWAIYYNHPTSITTEGHVYTVSKLDERTSSVSSLFGSVTWNTTQPATSVTSADTNCFASKCTAEDRRLAYHYAAHPLTGGCALTDASTGSPLRAVVGNTLVPAQGDQPTAFVNQRGQVMVAQTVVNPEKGASSLSAGGAMDTVMDLGWIEVSDSTHACRHATTQPPANACR